MKQLDLFIMTDQPEVCPKDGRRTEFIELSQNRQLHTCPCGYKYILVEA